MFCLIPFECECEECGQEFDGVFWRLIPEEEISPLASVMSDGMLDLAHMVDARNALKKLQGQLRNHQWTGLSSGGITSNVSYGTPPAGHACPHCGARQSWDPLPEPVEPKEAGGGLMGCSVLVCAGAGSLLGCVLMMLEPFELPGDITSWLIVGIIIGVIVGVVIGRLMNKSDDAEARASYPDRLAAYQRDVAAYNAYQESVAARKRRNEPVPDIENYCFAPNIVLPEDFNKHRKGYCPSCGKKLEGYAPKGSVQLGRAAGNCCPWCGAALPAGIRMKIGSE